LRECRGVSDSSEGRLIQRLVMEIERLKLGLDPDVLAAIDLVRWELELLTLRWAGVLPQASTSQP